tara:strand:+ start:1447 stop:1704 length:258 start_codon:yes stop_codon:yes gene_type:complete
MNPFYLISKKGDAALVALGVLILSVIMIAVIYAGTRQHNTNNKGAEFCESRGMIYINPYKAKSFCTNGTGTQAPGKGRCIELSAR